MRQAVVLKLEADPVQHGALLETLEAFNRACQLVADLAYEHRLANKIALQPLVYSQLRTRFGLSSQMAVRAISKACEAYKHDKNVLVRFDPYDPVILDPRLVSFRAPTHVSLLCLSGRQYIPFRFVEYTDARPDRIPGQADLILNDGVFLLHVCIDLQGEPTDLSGDEADLETSL
jgi:predicted transposase